ncbi:hypothetical protein S83_018903 [Arachis hypogaea]
MTKTKFFIIDSARIHSCLDLVGRDKKKEFAPTNAAFYSLGADLFLSQLKIEHIARCLGVPSISIPGDVPSILIVNIQIEKQGSLKVLVSICKSCPTSTIVVFSVLLLIHLLRLALDFVEEEERHLIEGLRLSACWLVVVLLQRHVGRPFLCGSEVVSQLLPGLTL